LSRLQKSSGGHQRAEPVPATSGSRGGQKPGARIVIAARRLQRNFADGFLAETVEDLWEPWMRHADQALEDDALLLIIQQELAKSAPIWSIASSRGSVARRFRM